MDARVHLREYKSAIAWIEINLYNAEEQCEIFEVINSQSVSIGFRRIKMVSKQHAIIDNADYLIYPKIDDETKEYILDHKGRVIIFLVRSSSFRPSSIWP